MAPAAGKRRGSTPPIGLREAVIGLIAVDLHEPGEAREMALDAGAAATFLEAIGDHRGSGAREGTMVAHRSTAKPSCFARSWRESRQLCPCHRSCNSPQKWALKIPELV